MGRDGPEKYREEAEDYVEVAAAVNRRPLEDYEALDGAPVRIICMAAARDDQHAEYLRVLAALSGVMKDGHAREALLGAETPGEVHAILTGGG